VNIVNVVNTVNVVTAPGCGHMHSVIASFVFNEFCSPRIHAIHGIHDIHDIHGI